MVLKEAFHAQNVLNNWTSEIQSLLSKKKLFTKTVEKHLKSKAYSEAEDEVVDAANMYAQMMPRKSNGEQLTAQELLDFALVLLDCREVLAKAISDVKKNLPIDLDVSVHMADKKRTMARHLSAITSITSEENTSEAIGYKMDNEGKQTTYRYPVETVTTINFDRNKFRDQQRKLMAEASEISAKVDCLMVTTEVPFESSFDFEGSLNDAVETYFATATGAEK